MEKHIDSAISVADRHAGDMRTWRHTDRVLAVFVHDHMKLPNEVLAVVKVECSSETQLVVEELEFVLPTLDLIRGQPAPSLADLDDGQRWDPPIWQDAAELERHRPARRLIEDERSGCFEVQHDAIAGPAPPAIAQTVGTSRSAEASISLALRVAPHAW